MRVAIVGCGNVDDRYATDLQRYPDLALCGVADLDQVRALRLAADHGCPAYADGDAVLADPDVDVVVNLTSHRAHAPITRAALESGKHVFSEKPLALSARDARLLVALAAARGLRPGSAPIVLLGELAQTAWRMVRDGRPGRVRLVYADVNWDGSRRGTRLRRPSTRSGCCWTSGCTRSWPVTADGSRSRRPTTWSPRWSSPTACTSG